MKIETAALVVGANGRGDDRIAVVERERAVLLVLAGGSGGTRNAGEAAQALVDRTKERFLRPGEVIDPMMWEGWLRELDREIAGAHGGETTAIVCVVEDGKFIGGASVGDSEAVVVAADRVVDLTRNQRRKPLVGSGNAEPRGFFVRDAAGILLLGSDGLFKYARAERLAELVRTTSLAALPDALVAEVRLPSGALHDDVSILAASLVRTS